MSGLQRLWKTWLCCLVIGLPGCEQAEPPTPENPEDVKAFRWTQWDKSAAIADFGRRRRLGLNAAGNWRIARSRAADPHLTDEQQLQIRQLEALGYMTGSRPPVAEGISINEPDEAYPGLNLYTSGHAPEAILMDMDGNRLHSWRYEFRTAFPDYPADYPTLSGMEWFCWMHLFENGDILGIYSGVGLVKLNARSEILWAKPIRAHHDLAVDPDGDIWVLTREPHMIPRLNEEAPILEDFVTRMAPDGKIKKTFSLLAAFEGTEFEKSWRTARRAGDLLHTNALYVLDGRGAERLPALAKGNLLVSMPIPNLVVVVNPETEKVVWAGKGDFLRQHDAQILETGNLLLFDNVGLGKRSRALEIDPATMENVWEYRGDSDDPLYSEFIGAVQRLPNGNTLITESENGRVIEVTPDGKVVWQFHSPHRAGDDGEFVAALCRMRRLPLEAHSAWLRSVTPG